jgi:predicted ABC-type ATPase
MTERSSARPRKPLVWILAGPNGSGKTTFYQKFLKAAVPIFINADDIAQQLTPGRITIEVALEAQRIADERRLERLRTAESFATETVFSHASKLEFVRQAQAAGFYVRVLFFCTEDPVLNATRVIRRVQSGGHDVPLDRIQPRYERSVQQAILVRSIADELWLFDNTANNRFPQHVARFVDGKLEWVASNLPEWAKHVVSTPPDPG